MCQHATEATAADIWAGCPDEAREAAERFAGSPAQWRLVVDRGGAAVWQVTGPGVYVAVKAGHGLAAAVVAREREALACMQSAIVPATVYGKAVQYGYAGDTAWLVRPWLDGPTTWEVFKPVRDGRPTAADRKQALTAAVDLCMAVGSMHQHGWVHGDLQPHHSVHVNDGRTVRLVDCAWAWSRDLPPSSAYSGGLVHLLSPDLAAKADSPTRQVITSKPDEVYALAASLWWATTGQWPLNYLAAAIDPAALTATVLRRVIAARQLKVNTTSIWPAFTGLLREVLTANTAQRPTAHQLAQSLRTLT